MEKLQNLALGSLFDGIGGFPYAASFYGIKTLWASEIMPTAQSVTRRHFPGMAHVGDITKLDGGKLPPVDIITFGSPCQGLSMAGLRLGLADERSGLFNEAIRIIREMQEATNGTYPKLALWENVPGALSTDGGNDFRAVLEAFTASQVPMPESGRWANAGVVRNNGVDIAWVVYNAQHFGVAQRRRRIFLIADFTGRRAGEILFVPKSLHRYFAAGGTPRQAAAAYAADCAEATNPEESSQPGCMNVWDTQQCRVYTEDGHAPTLAGADGGGERNPGGLVLASFMGGQSATSGGIGYSEKVTPTLKSGNSGSNMVPCVCEPELARTLTARGDSSPCADRGQNVVAVAQPLCTATGQANAEITENKAPTLVAGHEQPYLAHPMVSGTLCGSGAGLSRTAGMASETDLCVVQEVIPIHDRATRCAGGGETRKDDGSGNGLGVGRNGDPAPTIIAGDRHSISYCLQGSMVGRDECNGPQGNGINQDISFTLITTGLHAVAAVDCRNLKENEEISGTLQAKATAGYSLNYQNPVRIRYVVRRLTPVECERLQGYPDGWTEYGHDGKPFSDTKRYQMLGNSIAVPCVAYIMQGIVDALLPLTEGR